jgi:hypothetical protein
LHPVEVSVAIQFAKKNVKLSGADPGFNPDAGVEVGSSGKITCKENIPIRIDRNIIDLIVGGTSYALCPEGVTVIVEFADKYIRKAGTV